MAFVNAIVGEGFRSIQVPLSTGRDVATRTPVIPTRRRRRMPLMLAPETPESNNVPPQSSLSTALVLLSVPALWGSYGIAVKLILQHAPYASPEIVNTACYAVAAASLIFTRHLTQQPPKAKAGDGILGSDSEQLLPPSLRETYIAAAELGGYLFLGSYAQLVALEYTSASRSSFLVQLTTVLVPLLDVIVLGAKPSVRIFVASAVALIGVLVLGVGPGDGRAFAPTNAGDLLSLLSAAFYTAHVLRLQRILPRMPSALRLVEAKSVVQCGLSLATVAAAALLKENQFRPLYAGLGATDLNSGLVTAASIFWIGAFSTAAATVAQVDGQRRVGPSISAVVFSVQPLFAVAFAILCLHDHLSWTEVVGGALVVLSSIAVVI